MDPVVVLDAAMPLRAARSALSVATARDLVVVRRRDPRGGPDLLWYPLDENDRARVLASDLDPAMPLGVSLDLHEHGASEVRQLGDPDVTGGRWTGLVVDGARAVGWATARERQDRGPVRGIDFTVHRGEILGLTGLVGSGRSSVLKTIFGEHAPESGTMQLDGRPYAPRTVGDAMQAGVALVPEDRVHEASFMDQTVTENISLARLREDWTRGFMPRGRERSTAREHWK